MARARSAKVVVEGSMGVRSERRRTPTLRQDRPGLEHYAGGLLNPKGPIQADAIGLSSVSSENGQFPTISGYAQFQLMFDRAFRGEDGDEWDAAYEHGGIDFEILYKRHEPAAPCNKWRPQPNCTKL